MRPPAVSPTTLRAMNEALILGSLRQHELTEAAERLNSQLLVEMPERKQVEAALREAEGSYHDLFNSMDEGFCVIEKIATAKRAVSDYRYMETNPAFECHTGIQNVIGKSIRQLIPQEAAGWCRIYDTVLKTGKPERFERILEKTERILELFAFQVKDSIRPRVALLFRDITQRKKEEETQKRIAVLAASNQKLEREIVRRKAVEKVLVKSELHEKQLRVRTRQLAHQVLHSQEQERLRISRELHDQVVQTLIGINVRLVGLKVQAGKLGPNFRQQLSIAQNLVENSVATVHGLSRDLRPELLDILGFIPSLRALLKSFHADSGIRANLTVFSGVEKLGDPILTALYRVLQEALSNVFRHANADKVEIQIEKIADQIRMTIHDNGKGFAKAIGKGVGKSKAGKPNKQTRLGLIGMQERIEMLGGTFGIQCLKGTGTTVTVLIPLSD